MANAGVFDSPRRLVALTWLGCLLNLTTFVTWRSLPEGRSPLAISIGLCLALVGAISVYWAPYQLREGVQNERWAAAQVDPIRRVMEHPAWKVASVLMVLALFVMFFSSKRAHSGFWTVFLVSQAVTQLQSAFVRPRPKIGTLSIDWKKVRPLHSEHWGER